MSNHIEYREQSILQQQEKAVFTGFIVGLIPMPPSIIAIFLANSLTIVADTIRCGLETFVIYLSWATLRKIRKGRTGHYDYGFGKVEGLVGIGVALTMIVSFTIITTGSINRFFNPVTVKGGGMILYILLVAPFFVINTRLFIRYLHLSKGKASPILESQWRLFLTKSMGNLSVLVSLGIGVVFTNHGWAKYADPAGSIVLSGFILYSAYNIVSKSVFDLADRTLDESNQMMITTELARYFDVYEQFHGVRSRRSGKKVFIEIFLEFNEECIMKEVQASIDELKTSMEEKIEGSEVWIIPTRAGIV